VLVDERNLGCEAAEVATAGEDLVVGRGQHHAAHARIVPGGLQCRREIGQQLVGQRIAGLWLVERDRGDAAVGDLVAERFVGHGNEAYAPAPSEK
jgi:hypothetical protein